MNKRTYAGYLYDIEPDVVKIIAEKENMSIMDSFRLFLQSKTHEMLLNDDMKIWHFAPLVIFDIWENEIKTGDPRNSLYLKGDEID